MDSKYESFLGFYKYIFIYDKLNEKIYTKTFFDTLFN